MKHLNFQYPRLDIKHLKYKGIVLSESTVLKRNTNMSPEGTTYCTYQIFKLEKISGSLKIQQPASYTEIAFDKRIKVCYLM